MTLKLYNTRTRQKEIFEPLDSKSVRMYVCGPTVYDFAHIGNARPLIVFDVLFRLLQHLAKKGEWDGGKGKTKVTYVRNITDVDDKINARAAQEGIPIRELTEKTAAQFHADAAALGCLPPSVEPRATEHIKEMIALIKRLIKGGHAYAADGHVLFNVASDANYGSLARRSLDEMQVGARVEVAPYKRDAMDFVLWKPSTGNEPGWESPWGFGRPGWHLECSAMSAKYLGQTFDIHGGGIDLVFPHHENEVAQSTCAHGTDIMANVWMHNGHLQVEGQKMSKSLGNFVTINDLLHNWGGLPWAGPVLRWAMLQAHYRQPMNWTLDALFEARNELDKMGVYWVDEDLALRDEGKTLFEEVERQFSVSTAVLGALLDDLNTPEAIARIRERSSQTDRDSRLQNMRDLMFLGVINENSSYIFTTGVTLENSPRDKVQIATSLLNEFRVASANTDIQFATAIEDKLMSEGFKITDKEPYFVSAKFLGSAKETLEGDEDERQRAREAKDWAAADAVRNRLNSSGLAPEDKKNPITGKVGTTYKVELGGRIAVKVSTRANVLLLSLTYRKRPESS
jgi:cysteinyl-tRNA synthetase